jgi:hypothetical protein
LAFSVVMLTPMRSRAQEASDEVVDKITQLNKDAITAYQAKKYDDARKILKQALDAAAGASLDNHPITARTHVHMGVVIIVGFQQRDLGIKQFKKAIEIQPDINLTKTLVTPELADAFAEAKKAAAVPATPPPAEAKPTTPPPTEAAKPATPPPAEESNGLVHEAVTEARQGSAISITVGVQDGLQFERLVLAYRPDGGSEFLGREMKQVSDGKYGAEIPPPATSGSTVAYYIEAEDADGGLVASRGSVDSPLVIHLAGVGAVRHETTGDDDDDDDEAPEKRYFVGLMAGTGFGWASGQGDTNADVAINPSGLALAGIGQIAPEFGYWLTSSLLLSGQIRYEFITGTTDIYTSNPSHQYHTANYALAVFARATWRYLDGPIHPFFSLAAGGGRIRHVVSYQHQLPSTCGSNHNEACVDTIGAGPVLLGPGAGVMWDFGDQMSLIAQANSTLGFPTFTVNLDVNVGVAFGF